MEAKKPKGRIEAEGRLRFHAAEKVTVVATTPKGAFSLLKVVFMKNDGSVYVPFPYLGEKRGLLSELDPATEPDPKTVNLARAGIVVDYDVKCSFHTSGIVQFSKSGERELLPRRKGFPLKEAMGRLFEFRAYGLEGFEQVDLGTPTKDYRVRLRFPVHPTSIVVSGMWQRKKDIVTNMDGGLVGPDTTLIRRSDGFAQPGLFVGQPLGFPLRNHVLVLTTSVIPHAEGARFAHGGLPGGMGLSRKHRSGEHQDACFHVPIPRSGERRSAASRLTSGGSPLQCAPQSFEGAPRPTRWTTQRSRTRAS